jgi:hypothetical protein
LLTRTSSLWKPFVDADLDTLATALYAKADDLLKAFPERAPWRPGTGITPKISDAELLTLAVLQALLGFVSEARWLRFARKHLRHLFPYLPGQPGYNKRLRKLAATTRWLTGAPLARDTALSTDRSSRDRSGPCAAMRLRGSRGCRRRTAPTARPRRRR